MQVRQISCTSPLSTFQKQKNNYNCLPKKENNDRANKDYTNSKQVYTRFYMRFLKNN